MPKHITPDSDRRSEASKVGRELIRETSSLVLEQTNRYLQAPTLTVRLLREHEPIVERQVIVSNVSLLTRPRAWVRELLKTLEAAMLVEIVLAAEGSQPHLVIKGRWSDVQLAELTVQRTFVLATHAATYAYRTTYRNAEGKRQRNRMRGARKEWLQHFVTYLRGALGMVYEHLAEQHGVDALRNVVHNFEHAILPDQVAGLITQTPRRRLSSGRS